MTGEVGYYCIVLNYITISGIDNTYLYSLLIHTLQYLYSPRNSGVYRNSLSKTS